jgi:hypothetical protein
MAENIKENPGAVKGGQAVEEIPAENRWTITTQGLTARYDSIKNNLKFKSCQNFNNL